MQKVIFRNKTWICLCEFILVNRIILFFPFFCKKKSKKNWGLRHLLHMSMKCKILRKAIKKCSRKYVTNVIFRPKCKYKYIWVNIFLANTNTNTFGMTFFQGILIQIYLDSNILDDYKSQFICVYQKWANMNKNTIIWIDICE